MGCDSSVNLKKHGSVQIYISTYRIYITAAKSIRNVNLLIHITIYVYIYIYFNENISYDILNFSFVYTH